MHEFYKKYRKTSSIIGNISQDFIQSIVFFHYNNACYYSNCN